MSREGFYGSHLAIPKEAKQARPARRQIIEKVSHERQRRPKLDDMGPACVRGHKTRTLTSVYRPVYDFFCYQEDIHSSMRRFASLTMHNVKVIVQAYLLQLVVSLQHFVRMVVLVGHVKMSKGRKLICSMYPLIIYGSPRGLLPEVVQSSFFPCFFGGRRWPKREKTLDSSPDIFEGDVTIRWKRWILWGMVARTPFKEYSTGGLLRRAAGFVASTTTCDMTSYYCSAQSMLGICLGLRCMRCFTMNFLLTSIRNVSDWGLHCDS